MYFVLFFLSISSKRGKKDSCTKVDPSATYNRDSTTYFILKKKCFIAFAASISVALPSVCTFLKLFNYHSVVLYKAKLYVNENEPCKN